MSLTPWELLALIGLCAFLAEYIDSSLGMGYGTTLTPVLLLLGFGPLQVVPAVLFSEFVTGLLAAGLHHTFRNVNFRPGSLDLRVALALGACGLGGALVAVFMAIELPDWLVKTYIGALVLAMGLLLVLLPEKERSFSWRRLISLGLLGSFNKGLSGGGYGPVITAGQILSGLSPKSAIGITSLVEGVISLVAVSAYALTVRAIDWQLALPVVVGAVISTPLSAYTVRRLSLRQLRRLIGFLVILLGLLTLAKVLGSL
jgi:hypothetical protein